MRLHVTAPQIEAIATHAAQTYPQECCGLLLGTSQQGDRTVQELWPAINQWTPAIAQATADLVSTPAPTADDRDRRFWIDPQDILTAQQYARGRQLDIIGVYHSHPDQTAVPSACDRAFAWAGYSYIIVAIHQGTVQDPARDVRSWALDDQGQFQPEPLAITPASASTSARSASSSPS